VDLPDQGAPLDPVLTAITHTRGSLISTSEAKDIIPEVEIDVANLGKKCVLDHSTLTLSGASGVGLSIPR
jgi:hypothetical protein